MKYTEGSLGRIFVLKFDHEDDVYTEIHKFCKEKDVKSGQVQILGAINKSKVVVGPKSDKIPPEPNFKEIDEAKEVIGYGTIFCKDGIPNVHIHTVFSRENNAFIGCIRNNTGVFLVIEAIILEFKDVNITREFNQKLGIHLMDIKDKKNE